MVGKLMMTNWSEKLKLENIFRMLFMITIQSIEWEINFKENGKKKKGTSYLKSEAIEIFWYIIRKEALIAKGQIRIGNNLCNEHV